MQLNLKNKMEIVERQWGNFKVLHVGERYKVKELILNPGASISYQLHRHRHEHWINVIGSGRVILNDKEIILHENKSILIPIGTKHKLENIGKIPLKIIETQYGSYLEEDDIERFN